MSSKSKPATGSRAAMIQLVQAAFRHAIPEGAAIDLIYDALPKSIDADTRYFTASEIDGNATRTLTWLPNAVQSNLLIDGSADGKGKPVPVTVKYNVKVRAVPLDSPADKSRSEATGQTTLFAYPGVREDHIEYALRRLASDFGLVEVRGQIGVIFTMPQLVAELKRMGVTLSRVQIREGLDILSTSSLEVQPQGEIEDRVVKLSAEKATRIPLLVTPGESGEKLSDFLEEKRPDSQLWFAGFHPFLLASLQDYRRLRLTNHDSHAQLGCTISRFIHNQMRMFYRDASRQGRPFTISQKAVLEGVVKQSYGRKDSERRALQKAIRSMVKAAIVRDPKSVAASGLVAEEALRDDGDRRTILDWLYHLYPTDRFVSEMRSNNQTLIQLSRDVSADDIDPMNTAESVTSPDQHSGDEKSALDPLREFFKTCGIVKSMWDSLASQIDESQLPEIRSYWLTISANPTIKKKTAYLVQSIRNNKFSVSLEDVSQLSFDGMMQGQSPDIMSVQNPWDVMKKENFNAGWQVRVEAVWADLTRGERLALERDGMKLLHPDAREKLKNACGDL